MRHSTPGISKNARKKGKDIELEIRNLGGLDTLKNIILEGLGFRGGSDEKMRRMWFELEIIVAGLSSPNFVLLVNSFNAFKPPPLPVPTKPLSIQYIVKCPVCKFKIKNCKRIVKKR